MRELFEIWLLGCAVLFLAGAGLLGLLALVAWVMPEPAERVTEPELKAAHAELQAAARAALAQRVRP